MIGRLFQPCNIFDWAMNFVDTFFDPANMVSRYCQS